MAKYKFFFSAVMTIAIAAIASSCGQTKQVTMSCSEISAMISSQTGTVETIELSKDILAKKYTGIDVDELADFSVLMASSGASADEVAVFKVEQSDEKAAVQTALSERLAELEQNFVDYIPQEMPKIDGYILEEYGDYIVFAITPDQTKAKEAIKEVFVG